MICGGILLVTPNSNLPFKIHYGHADATLQLGNAIKTVLDSQSVNIQPVVLCIGTDRSTGDSLGPLVGSFLHAVRFPVKVYGTLEFPVHAVNLEETMIQIYNEIASPYILAVDACLGNATTVGQLTYAHGPLKPGAGVHKTLPEVGNSHITGVVNVGGFMEYMVLQNTRLNLVVQMADIISKAIRLGIESSSVSFPKSFLLSSLYS